VLKQQAKQGWLGQNIKGGYAFAKSSFVVKNFTIFSSLK
jgi:hypothetical protein